MVVRGKVGTRVRDRDAGDRAGLRDQPGRGRAMGADASGRNDAGRDPGPH